MNRRSFLKCSATCAAGSAAAVAAVGAAAAAAQQPPPPPPIPKAGEQTTPAAANAPQVLRRRGFDFEIEIVEGKCGPHQAGQKFKYPDEKGKICEWLMDSMNGAIRVLDTAARCPGSMKGRRTRR